MISVNQHVKLMLMEHREMIMAGVFAKVLKVTKINSVFALNMLLTPSGRSYWRTFLGLTE